VLTIDQAQKRAARRFRESQHGDRRAKHRQDQKDQGVLLLEYNDDE
jgi:hypothetical protein